MFFRGDPSVAALLCAVSPSCIRQTIQVFSRAKIGGLLRPAQTAPARYAELDQLKMGRDSSIRRDCPGRDSSGWPASQLGLSGAILTCLDLSRPNWSVLIPAVGQIGKQTVNIPNCRTALHPRSLSTGAGTSRLDCRRLPPIAADSRCPQLPIGADTRRDTRLRSAAIGACRRLSAVIGAKNAFSDSTTRPNRSTNGKICLTASSRLTPHPITQSPPSQEIPRS